MQDIEHPAETDRPNSWPFYEKGKWPMTLAVITPLVLLLLFINKAFHIDDTVFIWVARQIQHHPLDFYGFSANWTGQVLPISKVNQNPPGVSFFIALDSALFGESEVVLHLAFLLPAVAFSVGTRVLAKRLGARPALATLCAVLTPAFLVSSTNVMSDVLMMAFYVWSVVLWVHGLDRNRRGLLFAAGFLAGLSTLTKYFGVTAIPLLAAYAMVSRSQISIWERKCTGNSASDRSGASEPRTFPNGNLGTRKHGWWIAALFVPIIMIGAYQWYTGWLYGIGLLSQASGFAMHEHSHGNAWILSASVIGPGFVGGCIGIILFFAPFLWSYRALLPLFVVAVLAVAASNYEHLLHGGTLGLNWWLMALQWSIYIAAGLLVLSLPISDFWRSRDAASFLLLAWVIGTFVFAALINWITAARNILPMAPAVGILLARRVELRMPRGSKRTLAVLTLAAILSLSIARADYLFAGSARDAAAIVGEKLRDFPGKIYYSGHWGFQYYMEKIGAIPLPFFENVVADGDCVVVPTNNVVFTPDMSSAGVREIMDLKMPACRWLATMNHKRGAGFYASTIGVLPFVFGPIPEDEYHIFQVNLSGDNSPPQR